RAFHVTGVQTCALPISGGAGGGTPAPGGPEEVGQERTRVQHPQAEPGREARGAVAGRAVPVAVVGVEEPVAEVPPPAPGGVLPRSEERRVGKERGARRS